MTNLANWQDDIEALGGDFDGSLSGLCIMSLSFDFTRSGLGGAGGAGCAPVGQAESAPATATVGPVASGAGAHNLGAKLAESQTSSLATTYQPAGLAGNSRLSSTSALSLHHHHHVQQQQQELNENSMNAFKRFKSSLLLNGVANEDQQQQQQANQRPQEGDQQPAMTASATTLASSFKQNNQQEQIVRQLQNQIKSCLSGAGALANNSTLTTHYSSISLANHRHHRHHPQTQAQAQAQAQVQAQPQPQPQPQPHQPQQQQQLLRAAASGQQAAASQAPIKMVNYAASDETRSRDVADDERNSSPVSTQPRDDSSSTNTASDHDHDHDQELESSSSASSSVSSEHDDDDHSLEAEDTDQDQDDEDQDQDQADDQADEGAQDSRSASDMSTHRNNVQQDRQDLRISSGKTNQVGGRIGEHKIQSQAAERRAPIGRERGRRPRRTRQGASATASATATVLESDSGRPELQRRLSSLSVKDNFVAAAGATLKESSYTTSFITTTAPMHSKSRQNHHAHAHSRPFSIKAAAAAFPPSPYHQFSNSSFNHDLYERYLSHDSHQPLQTPLIGIERTQDLISLKLPPHGPDAADADSQRFTKEWLFGAAASCAPNEEAQSRTDGRGAQPSAAHENNNNNNNNNNKPTSGRPNAPSCANDLRVAGASQQEDEGSLSKRTKRLFGGAESGANSRHCERTRRDSDDSTAGRRKSFQFSYKSNSNTSTTLSASAAQLRNGCGNSGAAAAAANQREPIDLNVTTYCKLARDNEEADEHKSNMFDESMKHFNPNRMLSNCCGGGGGGGGGGKQTTESANNDAGGNGNNHQRRHQGDENGDGDDGGGASASSAHNGGGSGAGSGSNTASGPNALNMSHHYHGQESMFGLDQASKQRFQYVLAAPISVATKLHEDTMTYLNQGQAYEIKLANVTDVSEAKKGFMCSIINIGFHERHMQQAENELWQQWSQQHPGERIFSVDMKLSYNVFGVESDGLNKYEFLWDSSKVAGVFIRINSISTEFTPRKHGGEKGIPFKLSIETFSYNSKTHDSYFISAACCQIKVFKPKGAERKIRSDRDKIFKRPQNELEKYHQACEHTVFSECPLSSLHPLLADDSIGYYRHSHGHFASKQNNGTSASCTPAARATPSMAMSSQVIGRLLASDKQTDLSQQQNHSSQNHSDNNNNEDSPDSSNRKSQHQAASDSENSRSRDYLNQQRNNNAASEASSAPGAIRPLADYSTSRLLQATGNNLQLYHRHTSSTLAATSDAEGQHQGNSYAPNYASGHPSAGSQAELALNVGFGVHPLIDLNQAPVYSQQQRQQQHGVSSTQRSVASLTGPSSNNQTAQPFSMSSYYNQHNIAPLHQPPGNHLSSSGESHIPPPPPPPPHPPMSLVHQHASFNGATPGSSTLGPVYQAAAVAAAAAASTRALPANIYRQLSVGEKSINSGQQQPQPLHQSHHHHHNHLTSKPFRASNLALAGTHQQHQSHLHHQLPTHLHHSHNSSDHCGDTTSQSEQQQQQQQQELNKDVAGQQHSMGSLNSYLHAPDQQGNCFELHHLDLNNDHNHHHQHHHHPPQSSSALPQLYRQRSASTSMADNCSSYAIVSGAINHQPHHHHPSNNQQQQQQQQHSRPLAMMSDCYNSSISDPSSNHNAAWSSPIQSNSNPGGCLSRGCNSGANCLNGAGHNGALQHHPNGTYQTNSPAGYQQQVQESHHNHYEQHSEQDSPHKSHNSNESPMSCYSRYRDNPPVIQNDNNNTASPYSNQQQQHQHHQQHHHHHVHGHHQQQDGNLNQHHHHEQQHEHELDEQQTQLESMSRSSSSLLGGLADRVVSGSSCAEVLAWLLANRFGPFAKTFNNFSGADLLRLSKSELVEICGLPDGIRMFNSLHNQPIRTKRNRTFRTLRFGHQLRREVKMKRKIK